jgi:ABC-type antimicrobial peptide transport system permease subunit
MSTPITNIQACKCKKQEKQRKRQRMSFLLTVIVAILPKCPFCAFGYSSVLVMCSGAKIHQYEANSMGYLSIILAIAVLVSLFWNYKGRKTLVAATVATLGILPLIYAQIFSGNPLEYFVGTALILLAVLLNGRWFRKFGF